MSFSLFQKKKQTKKPDNPLLLPNNCQQQLPVITACITCYHCSQCLLIHLCEHLFNLHKVNLCKDKKKVENSTTVYDLNPRQSPHTPLL